MPRKKKTDTARKPGRPPSVLTEKYQLRMTPEDRARWEKCAADLGGIDLSDWIRIHAAKGAKATITIAAGGELQVAYPKES